MTKNIRKYTIYQVYQAILINIPTPKFLLFFKSFCQKDFFALFLVIFLASFVVVTRGSAYYSHSGGFLEPVKNYVEETAIPSFILRQAMSVEANISALFVGQESPNFSVNPSNTLQQTALLAFNSLENDFSEFTVDGKNSQVTTYIIQEGDMLSFIASDFGVSVNTIIWANSIKDIDSISPGDELKIPPINGVLHKVKKGETVASLATKYSAEQEKIIAFNALPKDGSLQVDDEVVIPEGKIASLGVAGLTVARFAYLPNLDGYYMSPTTGRNWGYIHGRNGVDMANSCGTPIYAAASGTAAIVDGVGWNGGFGKFIKLVHSNNTETIYAHASRLLIDPGESVDQGELIALMGSTGRSTGCHLHFEVHGARNPLAKY